MGLKEWFRRCQAALYMMLVQVFITGMMLLSRVVLSKGAFVFSLLTYRQIVATVFLAPLAFLLERGMEKKLSWISLIWIFLNGLLGITMTLGLYYYGIKDTSATFAANFLNLVPIFTFVLSTIAGMEKLGLSSIGGRVKIAGTILCVAGAVVITLYRGKPLHLWPSHMPSHHTSTSKSTNVNIVRGSIFLLFSCLSSATWFLVQVKLFKAFPSVYWATMLTNLAACLQSAIIGISIDRGAAAWRLEWNLNLLTIVYSGLLTSGASFCLISWTVAHRGPTYPPMFNPVSLVFVTILESLFMGEELFVGSLIGMAMIIAGLYAFLWGTREKMSPSNAGDGDVANIPDSTRSGAVAQIRPP